MWRARKIDTSADTTATTSSDWWPLLPLGSRKVRASGGSAGTVLGQYAYPIEAVASRPAPGREADNGVSEILAVNDHQVLVVERAGVEHADGVYSNHVRIYAMDTDGATDIQAIPALAGAKYVPARKRLLLDLEKIGLPKVDNIEGISWGPRLENGRLPRQLILLTPPGSPR